MPARRARTTREAANAAADLGFPVVLKVFSADVLHGSDIGGVRLGVAHPDAEIDGCLVAPMVTGGVETILGVQRDPVFGPIVRFGLGGIFGEAITDVIFRTAPFEDAEARTMIESVAAYRLLTGRRGQPHADLDALATALSRLTCFAATNAIEPLVINTFLVHTDGALAVDAVLVTHPPSSKRQPRET